MSDAAWMPDDSLYYAATNTPASLYDTARSGSSALWVESIGAQLKQKEGELMQMQVLLSEQNKLKESTNKELTRLTILADQVQKTILHDLHDFLLSLISNIFFLISIHK